MKCIKLRLELLDDRHLLTQVIESGNIDKDVHKALDFDKPMIIDIKQTRKGVLLIRDIKQTIAKEFGSIKNHNGYIVVDLDDSYLNKTIDYLVDGTVEQAHLLEILGEGKYKFHNYFGEGGYITSNIVPLSLTSNFIDYGNNIFEWIEINA